MGGGGRVGARGGSGGGGQGAGSLTQSGHPLMSEYWLPAKCYHLLPSPQTFSKGTIFKPQPPKEHSQAQQLKLGWGLKLFNLNIKGLVTLEKDLEGIWVTYICNIYLKVCGGGGVFIYDQTTMKIYVNIINMSMLLLCSTKYINKY